MQMLSDDDLNLRDLSAQDLARAWDLWFDLAQATNEDDPAYTHGVFQNARGCAERRVQQASDARGPETESGRAR